MFLICYCKKKKLSLVLYLDSLRTLHSKKILHRKSQTIQETTKLWKAPLPQWVQSQCSWQSERFLLRLPDGSWLEHSLVCKNPVALKKSLLTTWKLNLILEDMHLMTNRENRTEWECTCLSQRTATEKKAQRICCGDFIRGHLFHALLKTDVWVHFYSKLFKQWV